MKKVMCYLKAPGLDLDIYIGRKVTVSGTLAGSGGEGVPIVEVGNVVLE